MSEDATTRRDFLSGRSTPKTLHQGAVGASSEAGATAAAAAAQSLSHCYLLHITRRAMACEFAVYLRAGEQPQATDLAVSALDLVSALEQQLTVYRNDSEVSLLNRTAATGPVLVEADLLQLLMKATELWSATGGAFDITAGPLSKVWGFYRRAGRLPDAEALQSALDRVGGQHLQMDAAAGTVHFQRAGLEINLGGIGKGYALDRCARHFVGNGVENFVLHGGYSSVLARGARAGVDDAGWTVDLRHPFRPGKKLASFYLRDRALGTSGSATQSFHYQGRRYGHIIDPRTGWPADGVLSATCLCPSAASADALATAFFVMGVEKTKEYCDRHDDVAALMVEQLAGGRIALHAFGLAPYEWQKW